MHEFSIVRSLMRDVQAIAEREHATQVTGLTVAVGEFSGVDGELLRLAFEQSVSGTICESARLTVRPVPLMARCDACGDQSPVRNFRFVCSKCGHKHVTITEGEELVLESIRLES